MATGKSAVGRALAQKYPADFVDLDERIVERGQMTIAAIFAEKGEAAFRQLEREVLVEELQRALGKRTVISLGGGALLDRATRISALDQAVVVTLSARPGEILRRARAQDGTSGSRPLLSGPDPGSAIEKLLAQREAVYRECHGCVPTDGVQLDEVVRQVSLLWERDEIAVAAGEKSYTVAIGPGLIRPRLAALVGNTSGTLFVTDSNVEPLHGGRVRESLTGSLAPRGQITLTPGEEHKNLFALSAIFQGAFDGELDRSSTFVGLGGGVVTDMTGFAAATWVRGVRWIGCPTTLLSMVDASVGGKTGVDFLAAKNSVGAFWQPSGVICDVETLLTESERAYVGALSEVVKTALVGDPRLLDFLEAEAKAVLARDLVVMTEVIRRCVRVKARVVALDERENGIRAHLNLGHTIGHALESSGGFTALTHGEAVSLGLVAALRLGEKLGHTPSALTTRVLSLLKLLGLPHFLKRADLETSAALLAHDKKRAGDSIRFVFARNAGDLFTESIKISDLRHLSGDLGDD